LKWNDAALKPSDVTKPAGLYVDYWFYSSDSASIFSSTAVIDAWYKGNLQYDATTKLCKPKTAKPADSVTVDAGKAFFKAYAADLKVCNEFRGIVWKNAKSVAFAHRENWVVAWVEYTGAVPK
jgi:hypothetical protein